MKEKANNKREKSAVVMRRYGINTVVLTDHSELEATVELFSTTPDTEWFEGKGKAYMYKELLARLQAEDRYFEAYTQQAVSSNPRWRNFLDDCVILAALGAILYGSPIELIHPEKWDQMVGRSKNLFTASSCPQLLHGIPVGL